MNEPSIPTLKDVAAEAKVHPATASRALSPEQEHRVHDVTRQRVKAAARRLGYDTNALAKSLRTGTTGAIGVIVGDLANPFHVPFLRGIEFETRERGVLPLVAESHNEGRLLRSVMKHLLQYRVDGLILSSVRKSDEEWVRKLRGVPIVLAISGLRTGADSEKEDSFPEVTPDDFLGAKTATEHLLGLGHRRIAQLPGPSDIASFIGRAQGYAAAMAAASDAVDVSTTHSALDSSMVEGRRLTAELFRGDASSRPTAIFAHNDLMAIGALDALKDLGLRCPKDVSVVGYNDAPFSDRLNPPLTTVRIPGYELGRHSAQVVFSKLSGSGPPTPNIVLPPEFIERKSTARPPSV